MSRIRIYGDTSGYIELKAPDEASNTEVTLPEGGFAGQAAVDQSISEINQRLDEVEAIAILGL